MAAASARRQQDYGPAATVRLVGNALVVLGSEIGIGSQSVAPTRLVKPNLPCACPWGFSKETEVNPWPSLRLGFSFVSPRKAS